MVIFLVVVFSRMLPEMTPANIFLKLQFGIRWCDQSSLLIPTVVLARDPAVDKSHLRVVERSIAPRHHSTIAERSKHAMSDIDSRKAVEFITS